MNIYFACSITGGREYEAIYQELTAAMLADGHEVPTAHLAESTVVQLEGVVAAADVYLRDITWIEQAEALVAEVSVPSHGVGYEIGYALQAGKRVLCLLHEGRKISKMISGNPDGNLRLVSYREPEEAIAAVRNFVSEVNQTRMQKQRYS